MKPHLTPFLVHRLPLAHHPGQLGKAPATVPEFTVQRMRRKLRRKPVRRRIRMPSPGPELLAIPISPDTVQLFTDPVVLEVYTRVIDIRQGNGRRPRISLSRISGK